MTGKDKTSQLNAVYAAKAPDEVARAYNDWAATYDADMAKAGYRHPAIGLALFARHLPRGSTPVLDAGAGTGLVGEWLGLVGYPQVEALDLSEGMLAVARSKSIYSALHQAALGTALPFPDDYFAAVISTGVFTTGHVGAEGLDELIRATRPGGVIVLTVKDAVWAAGFADRIAELAATGAISLLEETDPYVSMPGEAGTTPSRALVFRVV
mgnify:CR=1 FL=1